LPRAQKTIKDDAQENDIEESLRALKAEIAALS